MAITGIESPNGTGLSPDGRKLYVAETFTGHIWTFDVIAPGRVAKNEAFWSPGGRVLARAGTGLFLDSLAVDSEGNVCVGTLGVGGILVVAPDGAKLRHLSLPDNLVTNLCFGGPGLRTAYVTLSQTGRLVALDWPCPGLRLNY